ncbi:hypothetical protein M3Y94_00581100 [Aphelenchoides besseyi]|nr:hypothetical protein M3Y94_00581100 [Aphelenchoides besseyi]
MPSSIAASADAEGLKCSVCGEPADGQHFGAYACRACCAFYRRTIARNLKYVCRFNNQCEISQSYRCLCRYDSETSSMSSKGESIFKSQQQRSHHLNKPIKFNRMIYASFDANGTSSKRKSAVPSEPTPKPQEPTPNLQSPLSNASSSSSTCPLQRPLPESSPTTSIAQRLKSLQAIMNKSKKTIIIDESSLPPTHPTLSKMLLGYEELQRLRDLQFARSSDIAGVSTRTFVEKDYLDMSLYVHMMYMEVSHVAEMLNLFHGFTDLPTPDKLLLFKSFWIHFTILERCFDTYRVLGPDLQDYRMVFSDGSVVNVMEDRVKVDGVTDCDAASTASLYSMLRPWFRLAAELLCPLVKQVQPTAVEMIFCFGIMLYGCEDQLSALYSETRTSELSAETLNFMSLMKSTLYHELNEYYRVEFPVPNLVERVGELMRFISKTERMVNFRKDDIIFTKTFNLFKVDIYLESIFNEE